MHPVKCVPVTAEVYPARFNEAAGADPADASSGPVPLRQPGRAGLQ